MKEQEEDDEKRDKIDYPKEEEKVRDTKMCIYTLYFLVQIIKFKREHDE